MSFFSNLFSKNKVAVHDNDAVDAKRLITASQLPFAVRESFKALYTNILYLNIEDKCKKIAVTSAVSGEGKTFVSTNLALTLAQNAGESKILLIDTDMRQPRVAKLLDIDNRSHGLSEYLAGIDSVPNFQHIPEHNLTILTSGGSNVNPTKLIGSSRMAEFLRSCEETYDYVIVDTPPVNIVTDAILLNELVNGYVISTRADYSDIKTVSEAVGALERVNAEIFGIVLTSLKLKGGRHYGNYKYGNYKYGHYGEEHKSESGEKND